MQLQLFKRLKTVTLQKVIASADRIRQTLSMSSTKSFCNSREVQAILEQFETALVELIMQTNVRLRYSYLIKQISSFAEELQL